MSTQRRGLGRGLGALIPTAPEEVVAPDAPELAAVEGAYFAELPLDSITPNPRQPRTEFEA